MTKKIFLAHRFDFHYPETVMSRETHYSNLLNEALEDYPALKFRLVSMATEYALPEYNLSPQQIIDRSKQQISKCDAFIIDLSEPKWRYIGSMLELAYANELGIPSYCYSKSPDDLRRPWLQGYTELITGCERELFKNLLVRFESD